MWEELFQNCFFYNFFWDSSSFCYSFAVVGRVGCLKYMRINKLFMPQKIMLPGHHHQDVYGHQKEPSALKHSLRSTVRYVIIRKISRVHEYKISWNWKADQFSFSGFSKFTCPWHLQFPKMVPDSICLIFSLVSCQLVIGGKNSYSQLWPGLSHH